MTTQRPCPVVPYTCTCVRTCNACRRGPKSLSKGKMRGRGSRLPRLHREVLRATAKPRHRARHHKPPPKANIVCCSSAVTPPGNSSVRRLRSINVRARVRRRPQWCLWLGYCNHVRRLGDHCNRLHVQRCTAECSVETMSCFFLRSAGTTGAQSSARAHQGDHLVCDYNNTRVRAQCSAANPRHPGAAIVDSPYA